MWWIIVYKTHNYSVQIGILSGKSSDIKHMENKKRMDDE